ncbi:ABC transporter ATP-binding protein [Bacillus sp. MUM 13]|uniref:ABC transporter ATP-binding protein n=1 Tax=Bacillus sp. MUM 13 TaxID=1678001 RepID=UPI0008F59507|nr:ABC transporter ATP-binding protein [Bacillus sp. MUM 13]OIK08168.1 spermidine/putrescine ABC transporter ATP-binding protein [Bacillus sp. MUM 13]
MSVSLKNVIKHYGGTYALKDVSLSFEKGKIYGLLGSNGSGKSTMLKLISGLARPSEGEIRVDGEKPGRRIASKVAYLPEIDIVYGQFTVAELIDFHHSQFPDFHRQKADEMLEFMGIASMSRIASLSKGNRGRVKLVLALSRTAPVILLDEPFSGLDPMVRDSLVASMLSFIDFEQQTVIIATHEIDEIETILDEVILIDAGHIIAKEEVESIRELHGKSVLGWMKSCFERKKESV